MTENRFRWADLGNIKLGRPNLGQTTDVIVYRLLQYSLRSALMERFDQKVANEVFCEAGRQAGSEFCLNLLDTSLDFVRFIADLQEKLKTMNVGILRMEKLDLEKHELLFTISEDLDCSGLPVGEEEVCSYDEGFIAGVLHAYTGKDFTVKEIDCWATGEKTCRFKACLAKEADD